MPARRSALRAVGWAVAVVALALAVRTIAGQWDEVRTVAATLRPRWWLVAASAGLVLAGYAVLIESWRRLLTGWGVRLPFGEAATLWLVSSLARYLPGAGMQIGALGMMARERGVSGMAAASAAVVGTLLNIATGIAVVGALAGPAVLRVSGAHLSRALVGTAAAAAALGVIALPFVVPWLARTASRLTGRDFGDAAVPPRVLAAATLGNVVAWLLYGAAFRTLSAALLGPPTGATGSYVAVYTASYLWGLFAFAVPAGIGAQELALSLLMPPLAALPLAQTAVLTVAARLWRTVLETIPAALLLLGARLRAHPDASRSSHGTL